MGGGIEDSFAAMEIVICQICDMKAHSADNCPWFCPPCYERGCKGILKVWTSQTSANPGRKFLRCMDHKCKGFKWLDVAIEEATSVRPPGSSSKGNCFLCGAEGHWKKDCPSQCKKCGGVKDLRTSNSAKNPGRKYSVCGRCGDFSWYEGEVKNATVTENNATVGISHANVSKSVKITIEGDLNDICQIFTRNVTVTEK